MSTPSSSAIDNNSSEKVLPIISFSSDDARSKYSYIRAKRIKGDFRSKVLSNRIRVELERQQNISLESNKTKESHYYVKTTYIAKLRKFVTDFRDLALKGFSSSS